MDRRTLLKNLPFIPIVLVIEREEGYVFDFSKNGPKTDHPRYKEILSRGYHNQLYLNGEWWGHQCFEFRTGSSGYIKIIVTNVVEISTGKVLDPPPKSQRYTPSDNGPPLPLYEEVDAVRTFYGDVRYVDLRVDV